MRRTTQPSLQEAREHYDLEACAELLFADTVRREEFASALPAAGPG